MKKIERIIPKVIKREIAPKIIKSEVVGKIGPKVLKAVTPWYIRWFYSIFEDSNRMATSSSIAPEGGNSTTDSLVRFSIFQFFN